MQLLTQIGLCGPFPGILSVNLSSSRKGTLIRNINSVWSLGPGRLFCGSSGTSCQGKRKQASLWEEEGLPRPWASCSWGRVTESVVSLGLGHHCPCIWNKNNKAKVAGFFFILTWGHFFHCLYREKGREEERERNVDCLPPAGTGPGIEPVI